MKKVTKFLKQTFCSLGNGLREGRMRRIGGAPPVVRCSKIWESNSCYPTLGVCAFLLPSFASGGFGKLGKIGRLSNFGRWERLGVVNSWIYRCDMHGKLFSFPRRGGIWGNVGLCTASKNPKISENFVQWVCAPSDSSICSHPVYVKVPQEVQKRLVVRFRLRKSRNFQLPCALENFGNISLPPNKYNHCINKITIISMFQRAKIYSR